MKKPMLNAIQKARMSTAMKSKNPKMNPGFESLPKEVQMKIMKSKKPKMAMMKKPMLSKKKNIKKIVQRGKQSDIAELRKKYPNNTAFQRAMKKQTNVANVESITKMFLCRKV